MMEKLALTDQVAIITGAGRGIGRAVAIALSRHGARVVLVARSEDQLRDTASRIEALAGQALVHVADIGMESTASELIEATRQHWGRLDILVNNAGLGEFGLLEESTVEDWDRMMNINARGAFLLCREAIPLLRRHSPAFIFNIGSVVAHKGYVHQALYGASKHALLGLSKSLAKEVQKDGIRVHVINPGGVATDMVKQARPDLDPAELIAPEEIADIVLFLLGRQGNAVIDEINVRRASAVPWA